MSTRLLDLVEGPMTMHFRRLAVASLSLFLSATSVQAQTRIEDVRLTVSRHGMSFLKDEGVDEVRGLVTVDAVARELRFESGTQVRLQVRFEQLSSLHYEESKYPRPAFAFRRPKLLTIHYVRTNGDAAFEILRLPNESAPRLLEALERDTGLRVDRSLTTTSFLGLPIHLIPGYPVIVTDSSGRRIRAGVVSVSQSSIDLGSSGRFDAASIRQINVVDPLWNGAIYGALTLGYPVFLALWNRNYCDDCSALPSYLGGSAVGAVAGALIDRRVTRIAYRAQTTAAAPTTRPGPSSGDRRRVVQVSFRF